jgi:hypothetical protein
MTIATIKTTYQRQNASGEKCIILHKVNVDVDAVLYPEYIAARLDGVSLHGEFLRSGWYLKQTEWDYR